jgi:aconitate hydratase
LQCRRHPRACPEDLRKPPASYYSLPEAEKNGLPGISRCPFHEGAAGEPAAQRGRPTVTKEDILAVAAWLKTRARPSVKSPIRPARVLMQDFTGVPAVVDLAAMRDAMKALGGDPEKINPLVPVDLVIDHSVIVDEFGTPTAFARTSSSNTSATASATSS